MPHPMDFSGNSSSIFHSENIYYMPGTVLGAGATTKKDVAPASRTWKLTTGWPWSHWVGKGRGHVTAGMVGEYLVNE